MKSASVLFGIMLFLQGCTYAISPGMADKADKTIPFDKLQADPASFKGTLLILGGTITQTIAVKRGTLVEVDQKPLDYWGKPERTRLTGGRFILFSPRYLNEMAYAPGVDITIAVEVLGTGSPMIGKKQYDHPVLLLKEVKLWEGEPRFREKAPWMDRLYDPALSGRPE
jgi:starvation-inducible outer membrane lipoprotein